ncbi:hypothetical protein EDB84DRAFT_1563269 [Lactarius hengduanensis]|nr:hypothetical protein EDB84DRAFT_1563269 [Lactarius hengduanensis]
MVVVTPKSSPQAKGYAIAEMRMGDTCNKERDLVTPSVSAPVSLKPLNPVTPAPRNALSFDIAGEQQHAHAEHIDHTGGWLHGQELMEAHLSSWHEELVAQNTDAAKDHTVEDTVNHDAAQAGCEMSNAE